MEAKRPIKQDDPTATVANRAAAAAIDAAEEVAPGAAVIVLVQNVPEGARPAGERDSTSATNLEDHTEMFQRLLAGADAVRGSM